MERVGVFQKRSTERVNLDMWSVLERATSLQVVNMIFMDPAAVSRAMKALAANGYVRPVIGRFKGRSKPFEMTASGAAKFEKVRQLALQWEKVLLRSLNESERSAFLLALQKIHAGINDV